MSEMKVLVKKKRLSPKKLKERLKQWDEEREDKVKNKLQMSEKEKYTIAQTLLLGILIGVFSNIVVTNIYRAIDGKADYLTLLISLLALVILIFVILSWIDRIKFGIKAQFMKELLKDKDLYEDIEVDEALHNK